LPHLQERVHPLASSAIISILWGLWQFNGLLGGQAEAVSLRKGGRDSSPTRIWIGVEYVAVLYEQYMARKVKIAQEPTNYTWAYQMIVEDLDGNLLVFGSAPLEDKPLQDQGALGIGVP
jgi:hypothetical protein